MTLTATALLYHSETGEHHLWHRWPTSSTAGIVACHDRTAIFTYSFGGARWAL
jgi:hypothetical protein